jgi:hypothetical protein
MNNINTVLIGKPEGKSPLERSRRRREDNIKLYLGRAMAQVVRRRPLTAEARVRAWVNPCGICGGQSGTVTGFSPSS